VDHLFAHFSPIAIPLMLLPVAYLQRAARGRALRHAAAHDPKTQLWNHAAWQTLSSAALANHRAAASSAVLMVDLDHFKRLNDTYGHHAGDDVLTSVAHVLQTTTRRNDIVARFGGEEFSILLPGVTEQEACQAAERIRDQIAALTVITTNLDGHPTAIRGVTASIGVATTHRADTSVDDLLVHADRWLYQAKETGRNRVCGPVLAAA
jgi:diguanylate cyclase (GGDEF)-like protein